MCDSLKTRHNALLDCVSQMGFSRCSCVHTYSQSVHSKVSGGIATNENSCCRKKVENMKDREG
jgi:hypothetical protein